MKIIAGNSSYIDIEEVGVMEKYITPYIGYLRQVFDSKLYSSPEGLINLPMDDAIYRNMLAVAENIRTSELKYILLVGIGGSSLGAKAVYDALLGSYDTVDLNRFPKIIFIDTSESEYLTRMLSFIDKYVTNVEEITINAISKSGTTTETIVNVEVVLDALKNKFGVSIINRVVITTERGSILSSIAKDNNITCIELEKTIPGRFSVFSAAGLFPLILAGVDVDSFKKGAADILISCLDESLGLNPAAVSAIFHFHHYNEGLRISDNFFFHPQLESLGKWYRQLMAESLGKEKDKEGNLINSGILPIVSIGSTDLHSVTQLTLAGPRNRITSFVWSAHTDSEIEIPATGLFIELVSGVSNQPVSRVMDAILRGTKIAYDKVKLPYIDIMLTGLNSYSLGEFMQYKMIEVMLLGQLLNIDSFNQPSVEIYKEETRKILSA